MTAPTAVPERRRTRPLVAAGREPATAREAAPAPSRREPDAPARRRVRWLPGILSVLLVVVAAELAVRVFEDEFPPRSGWISDEYPRKLDALADIEDRGGVGVLLVGSSVADVSVDPALLPPEATGARGGYNAGLIGATPRIVETWASEVAVPRASPDTVVIAISSRDVNGNGVGIASADALFEASAGGKWLLGTESTADRIERWLDDTFALSRNRQALRRPLESLFGYDPPDRNFTEVTESGLETHLLDASYRSDVVVQNFFRAEPLFDFALDEGQLGALDRLVAGLEADGVRVVVLDVPVTADYIALHPRGGADYGAYTAEIDALAARNGAEVLRPGVWDVTLFSDPLHLNGTGVTRLTAELGAALATPAPAA